MLLDTDNAGRNVWHWAATRGHLETLQILWELAKENLTIEEINNKLLLGTDKGRTVWNCAAMEGHLETLKHYGNGLKRI